MMKYLIKSTEEPSKRPRDDSSSLDSNVESVPKEAKIIHSEPAATPIGVEPIVEGVPPILEKYGLSSIHPSWYKSIEAEVRKPYFDQLYNFVSSQRKQATIFPPANNVYTALRLCALSNVKVVILGQDPYHGPGQAHGLAFSVLPGVKQPPSLVNILKEIENDLGFKRPAHGCLEYWASQGVLLLNACLTVESGKANSHAGKGWERFTESIIQTVNSECSGVVFMLWGKPAQDRGSKIDRKKHLVLLGPHPSPLSAHRGFFGCKHFSLANAYLKSLGKSEIDWRLDPKK